MTTEYLLIDLCQVECVTVVKTLEAVDQDKQGISGMGFGQLVTARDAIWTQRHTRQI